MTSRLVTFRIPEDLYQSFQEKCSNEGQTASEKLRHFIDDYLYPLGQTQAASPAETDEVKEPGAEQPILKERITKVEEYIEHLEEPLGEILERLDNIEQALPQAAGAGSEDESELAPDEEQKEKLEGKEKEEAEEPWPFNLSFFKKE